MNDRFMFRCWSTKKNKFIDMKTCSIDNVNGLMPPCREKDEDFILMQSTGLKDRHGKLIYEGDIIKVKGKQTDETIGFVEWLNDFGKFSLNVDSCCIYTDFDYLPEKEIEIIGNIYQNTGVIE